MSIIISADSTADLSAEITASHGIKIIPLHILYDDAEYLDGVTITADEVAKKFDEEKKLPSTSAVSTAEYTDFFRELSEDGQNSIIHFSLSSKISSTYSHAAMAAEEVGGVYVIDTLSLTTAMGLLILKACDLRDKGFETKEIVRIVSELVPKVKCSFLLDKLDFMVKGGRCSAVKAFGANILGLKPGIIMTDGTLGIYKKYRGKPSVCHMQYISDALSGENVDRSFAFVISSVGVTDEQVDALVKEANKLGKFEKIYITKAGCTITSHCGKNCVSLCFLKK